MATARDKLISDWRERLAAAEAVDTTSDSRPAWLARLQIRLYRFLLSLYGDAEWTTTPTRRAARKSLAEDDSDSVVFDSPTALPLAGKPAKSLGQIQAVLKSVANAQSQAPACGPLVQGLTPECWVTVALAATKNWPRIMRLAESLQRRGIETRLQHHGSRYVLEVRASGLQQAVRIAREPRPRVQSAPTRVVITRQSEPGPLAPYFLHVMVIAFVVGLFTGQLATVGAAALQLERNALHYYREPVLWAVFFGGWFLGATVIVAAASSLDLLIVAGRDSLKAVRRGTTAEFFAGLGWQCLAAGVFVGPFVGLLAAGVAEHQGPDSEAVAFFAGWLLSVVVAGFLYLACQS